MFLWESLAGFSFFLYSVGWLWQLGNVKTIIFSIGIDKSALRDFMFSFPISKLRSVDGCTERSI